MGRDKNNEKNNNLIMLMTSVSPVLGACDRHAKQYHYHSPSAMAATIKFKPLGWMIP